MVGTFVTFIDAGCIKGLGVKFKLESRSKLYETFLKSNSISYFNWSSFVLEGKFNIFFLNSSSYNSPNPYFYFLREKFLENIFFKIKIKFQ